jgi:hypothetical protein
MGGELDLQSASNTWSNLKLKTREFVKNLAKARAAARGRLSSL